MRKNNYQILKLIFFISLPVSFSCIQDYSTLGIENPYPHAIKQNIDMDELIAAYSQAREITDIKSLLVGRNGVLVAEEYFNGHGQENQHDIRSVTKSILSILIGIAIDKGFITSVDQSISDFLGGVVDSLDNDKRNITIRHLLTMSSGLEWAEFGDWSEYNRWRAAEDQINYILGKQVIHTPGSVFDYNDGASHLLSVILSEASGISTYQFADKYLFTPLDIGQRIWPVDSRGYCLGCVALQLTSRDMYKLGILYLQGGIYHGKKIVSQEWIRNSTAVQIQTKIALPYGSNYGFLWWMDRAESWNFYYAMGYGGQFIFNVPGANLVVVSTCEWQGVGNRADGNWYNIINLIVNKIVPAVK